MIRRISFLLSLPGRTKEKAELIRSLINPVLGRRLRRWNSLRREIPSLGHLYRAIRHSHHRSRRRHSHLQLRMVFATCPLREKRIRDHSHFPRRLSLIIPPFSRSESWTHMSILAFSDEESCCSCSKWSTLHRSIPWQKSTQSIRVFMSLRF